MTRFAIIFFLFLWQSLPATSQKGIENIIIITADGLRWQELFTGMDSSIANNNKFNQGDSEYIFKKYWTDNATERRKMLMPFMWSTIASEGQVVGNRNYECNVNTVNAYKFSYPGYSEIFTGFADTLINSNAYTANPHINLLEFINRNKKYRGKVAAFTAWDAFDRILNEKRSGVPVVAAFDTLVGNTPSRKLLNRMLKDSYKPFDSAECLDLFTHFGAMDHLKTEKPKVLYIGYGETDEWAHHAQYKDYLNAMRQTDKWIGDIWTYIQSDSYYKNKTALFITTDHGRGDKIKEKWTSHGESIEEAGEIWFAIIAPGIKPKGEVKEKRQFFQNQFAQTMASLLGLTFKASHPVGRKIEW